MKEVYLAIHILIDGKKNTKTMTLDVTDDTYELLTKLAEDDVVDNREIYENYEELSEYVEEPVNVYSKELGMTVDDELYCSLQIRLDCPWDVALERYLKELEERLANGDVQALLDKGYYLKYECDDFYGAMELYREAMRRDAQNATDYLFDDDSVFGVSKKWLEEGGDHRATALSIISYLMDQNIDNVLHDVLAAISERYKN